MALRLRYINNKRFHHQGFTLLEVLLVLVIFSGVLSATLFATTTMYQAELLRSERMTVMQLLQTARNHALINHGEQDSGVAFNPPGFSGYVLFVGASLAQSASVTREYIPSVTSIILATSTPAEIVFEALSGDVMTPGNIMLVDTARGGVTTTILVNHRGYVGW